MTVSLTAMQAMFAQQTGEVFLTCVKLEEAGTAAPPPLLFVNDMVDLVRSEGTYIAFPFKIELPTDSESEQAQVQLVIDNVDRQIVQKIRSFDKPPVVTMDVVLASSPDTVEAGPFVFEMKGAAYDALTVTLTLGYEVDLLNMPANRWRITPQNCPGSF